MPLNPNSPCEDATKVVKRTFEAKQHPKGSLERERLNSDWLTSEYMPSYHFGIREDDGAHTPFTYRTKAEAERRMNELLEERARGLRGAQVRHDIRCKIGAGNYP